MRVASSGFDEGFGNAGHIGQHRLLQAALAEGGGRVVHGVSQGVRRAGLRAATDGACRGAADARAGHEGLQRVPAEGHDQGRIEHLELALAGTAHRRRSRLAPGSRLPGGRHLTTFVMKTSSRFQPIASEQLVEQTAGRADKRPALAILV